MNGLFKAYGGGGKPRSSMMGPFSRMQRPQQSPFMSNGFQGNQAMGMGRTPQNSQMPISNSSNWNQGLTQQGGLGPINVMPNDPMKNKFKQPSIFSRYFGQ